ncbi:hypothetical protein HKX48_002389 [Thoreauomyces humboldtii]|nr:hypothetical protein HKX48_002389 [Thoreauomyces humboldtii]
MAKKERVAQKSAAEEEKKNKEKAAKEAQEGEKWSDGAKSNKKKEEEEKKKQELLQKKKEREEMLAAEEKELAAAKPVATRGAAKKAQGRTEKHEQFANDARFDVPEFGATGIDAALDLLELVDAPQGAAPRPIDKMERHPEKRMKSAWAAFEEREMPLIKEELPKLRLTQYKQLLQKRWKKSPENPMNQQTLAYDTTRQEERELAEAKREETLGNLRTK